MENDKSKESSSTSNNGKNSIIIPIPRSNKAATPKLKSKKTVRDKEPAKRLSKSDVSKLKK